MKPSSLFGLVLILVVVQGCTTIPPGQRAEIRTEVGQSAEETVALLMAGDPSVQGLLNESVGYMAG